MSPLYFILCGLAAALALLSLWLNGKTGSNKARRAQARHV